MLDTATIERVTKAIYAALGNVDDPELGVNLIDLGLVYGVKVTPEGFVTITMTLTIPGCPMYEALAAGVGAALGGIPELTGGEIELVWEPRWTPERLTVRGRRLLGLA